MFQNLAPNLMVKDVTRSVKFYTETLGFDFIMAVPEGSRDILPEFDSEKPLVHAMVRGGRVEFMFHKTFAEEFPEFEGKTPIATLSMYIVLENLEKFYEKVKEKVKPEKELTTQWYGMKEFYVKDPDGYILGFAEKA